MLLNDGLQFSGGRYSQGQTWQWLLRLLQNGASCGGDLVGRLVACFGVAHLVVLSSAWAAIREPKWAAVKGVCVEPILWAADGPAIHFQVVAAVEGSMHDMIAHLLSCLMDYFEGLLGSSCEPLNGLLCSW